MSWLSRMLASDAPSDAPRDPLDDRWWVLGGRRTSAGVIVTIDKALTVPVVYACGQVLAETVAGLPWAVYERRPNGDRVRAERHPVALALREPDGESTPHEWIAQMVWDLCMRGNFMARRLDAPAGPGLRLVRMDPGRTLVERLPDGSRRWTETGVDGAVRRHVEGEVLHIRVPPIVDALVGTAQVHVGREAIGALLALMEYGASHFENDAVPPAVLKHPGAFADAASKRNFMRAVQEWFGRKRRAIPILEYGIEIQTLAATNEQAQYLETRKELQAEVARIWRMPPHKVGIMERATFSNIEHQALEFVTDTLGPWLDLIESAINRELIAARDRFYFEFNVAGLLRGDIKARYEAYAIGRQWGWYSVNDIRRLENLNGIGRAGDHYLEPMNMAPAGSAREEAVRAELLGADGRVLSRLAAGEWRREHGA